MANLDNNNKKQNISGKDEPLSPNKNAPKAKKKKSVFARIILGIVLFLLFLVIGIVVAFSFSFTRNWAAQRAIAYLNQTLNTKIEFQKIDFDFVGDATLKGIKIKDYKGNPLLTAKEIELKSSWLDIIRNSRDIKFKSIVLDSVNVNVVTYKGDSVANFIRFVELFDNGKKPDPNKPSFKFSSNIKIKNSKVSIVNKNHPVDEGKWLDAKNMNLDLEDLKVVGANVDGNLKNLNFVTDRWGKTHDLKTFSAVFSMNKNFLSLKHLNFITDKTSMRGELKMIKHNEKWEDFTNRVKLLIDFKTGSYISGDDIGYFAKNWDNSSPLNISGHMEGPLNNFMLSDFAFGGKGVNVYTQNASVSNILKGAYKIKVNQISTNFTYQNLKKLFPTFIAEKMGNAADDFGAIKYKGAVSATPEKIIAQGHMISGVGQAKISRLTIDALNTKTPKFDVLADATDLNLGILSKNNLVGRISGHFDVQGESFDINTMKLRTKSTISNFEIIGKTLHNITLDGNLSNKRYNGIFNINDPQARADVKGAVDFSTKRISADVSAQIAHLNLAYFTGNKQIQSVKGNIDGKIAMTNLDDLTLDAKLTHMVLQTQEQIVPIENAAIKALVDNGERVVSIDAPNVIRGKINGAFKLSKVGDMLQSSFSKLLAGNSTAKVFPGQNFNFDFDVSQGVVNLIDTNLRIPQGIKANGYYAGGTNNLVLNAEIPYLKYRLTKKKKEDTVEAQEPAKRDSIVTESVLVDINTSEASGLFSVKANKAYYSDYTINEVSLTGQKENKDVLNIGLKFVQGNADNEESLKEYAVNLNQTVDGHGDYVVRFSPTNLKLNDFVWKVDTSPETDHYIVYHKKTGQVDIHNLKFYSDDSNISVNGIFKDAKNFDIDAEIQNVQIAKILALNGKSDNDMDLKGVADGSIKITMDKSHFEPMVDLKINKVSMNGKDIGTIAINAKNSDNPNIFDVNARVLSSELFDKAHLVLTGTIDNNGSLPKLDLKAEFNDFDLAFAQDFVKSIFSDFRGKASGEMKIFGPMNDINYGGDISLKELGFKMNFTGVDYKFDDLVVPIKKGYAMLNDAKINDGRVNSEGSISGVVQFGDGIGLNLIVRAKNFLLLNTTQRDFDTFWGRIYGDADIFVDGPATELDLNAKINVRNNSVFTLNSASTSSVEEFKMLRFTERDKNGLISIAKKKTTGPNMNVNFDVTVDKGSTVNVLVGQDVGDISVRGKAEGLKFRMTRSGNMFMNGTYLVDNGSYVSKAILERKFQIERGSSMSWDSDVLNPLLNITADYFRTVTNIGEYLNIGKLPAVNVKLTTKITRTLKNPKIEFNVSAPDVSSQIREALAFKMEQEDEKVLQFGSVLVLNNFNIANSDIGDFSISNTLESQGYSLLFKQLGNVFNSISNKFQIDLNYIKGNQATNTGDRANAGMNIFLSPRVTIKTGLGIPITKNEYSNTNFLSGEGTFEYDWSKNNDGSRIFRFYSKPSNITNVLGQNASANQTWGVGVVYSKSFNHLLPKQKKKNEMKDSSVEKNIKQSDSLK